MANDLIESKIAQCKDAGLAGAFLTFSDLVVLHQELTRLRAAQADGPEYEDGCDHEGFNGGCERFGHTVDTCPRKPQAEGGEVVAVVIDSEEVGGNALDWKLPRGVMDLRIGTQLYTTPQPAPAQEGNSAVIPNGVVADAVRGLVEKWRADGDCWYGDDFNRGRQASAHKLADELEAALAAEQDDEYLAALDDLWKRVGNDDPLYKSFLQFVNTASVQAKVPEWQPIETAPKDDTEFLGWDGHTVDKTWVGWGDADPVYVHSDYIRWEPTHWMPLPAAPSPKVEE